MLTSVTLRTVLQSFPDDDILDTVQKLINPPPGQLAAAGVLAGIIWKFFERVEAIVTDNKKLPRFKECGGERCAGQPLLSQWRK